MEETLTEEDEMSSDADVDASAENENEGVSQGRCEGDAFAEDAASGTSRT